MKIRRVLAGLMTVVMTVGQLYVPVRAEGESVALISADEEETEETESTAEEPCSQDEVMTEMVDVSDQLISMGAILSEEDFEDEENVSEEAAGVSDTDYAAIEAAILSAVRNWDGKVERINVSVGDYNLPYDTGLTFARQVINKHPEFFYLTGQLWRSGYSGGKMITIGFTVSTEYHAEEINSFYSKAESILDSVDENWTDVQKAAYIHDWLVTHVEYAFKADGVTPDAKYNAYNALIEGSAVCQGYSEAYMFLMNSLGDGFECDVISSKVLNHAWNLITIGGKKYYVDCTWDDPSNRWYEYNCRHTNFLRSRSCFYTDAEHTSTDWVSDTTGDAVYSAVQGDTKYDNAPWMDMCAVIPMIGTYGAYCNGKYTCSLYAYDFSTDTSTKLTDYSARWYVWGEASVWSSNFSGLGAYGNNFYVTTATEVLKVNKNGGSPEVIYELSDDEKEDGYIYGSITEDGYLKYQLYTVAYETERTGAGAIPLEEGNVFRAQNTTVSIGALTYNGSVLTPSVTVDYGETRLTAGTDYTVTIKKGINTVSSLVNAGTYTAVISGKGEYSGSVTKEFTVAQKSITPTIEVSGTYTYNGKAQNPTFTVKDGGAALTAGTDYTAVVSDNINAGTAKITVSAVAGSNYAFSDTVKNFTINKKEITGPADINVYVIKTAGTATAVIEGMPSNSGTLGFTKGNASVTGSASITSWSVSNTGAVTVNFTGGAVNDKITLPVIVSSVNFEDITINVFVTLQDKNITTVAITEGETINRTYGDADITLHTTQTGDAGNSGSFTYTSSNESVATVSGTGKVHITGVGSTTIGVVYESDTYKGSKNVTVYVSKKTLTIQWSDTQLVYNGTEQGPVVSYSGKVGSDVIQLNVSGEQTVPGTYSALLSISGADADKYDIADADATCSYTIAKAGMADAEVTVDDTVTYNGGEQTVAVNAVMLNGNDIKEYCDVSGNKQTNAGTYTMTVTAKENSYYTGSVTVQYIIKRKNISPSVMNDGSFVYTGQEIRPDIMVMDGSNVLTDKDLVITYSDNRNVGTAKITIDAAEDGNYYFATRTVTFKITKAVTEDKKITESDIYGKAGAVDLSELIKTGGNAVIRSVSDNDAILVKDPVIKDGKLEYAFKDDETLAGKSATVEIEVCDADNYEDYGIEVTLTITECLHSDTEIRGVLEANCTDEGYTGDKYCKKCGRLLEKGSVIPVDPDKHDYDNGKITKEATVFEEGVKTYTCRRCGHTRTEVLEKIPAVEDMSDLLEDMDPENDKIDVIRKDKEDGSTETVIVIGDEEVSTVTTDPDGVVFEETKIWIAGLKSSYAYCGAAIKPEIHVYDGLRRLTEGSDYSVSYKNNKKSGKDAKLILSFKGSYSSTEKKELSFEIKPAELGKDVIAKDGAVSIGGKPAVNLIFAESGKKVPAKDLEISYSGDTSAAGTITADVKPASADYSGSTQVKITVVEDAQLMLENAVVKTEQKKYTYTGKPVVPDVVLALKGTELKKDIDYTVSQVLNNVEPGTATMVLEAVAGNTAGYVGSKVISFKIVKGRVLENGGGFVFEMSRTQAYEKGGVKPVVKVLDGDAVLKEGTDYNLTVKGNKKAGGNGRVTVKGKGKYKGSVTLDFTVEKSDIGELETVSVDAIARAKNGNPGAVIIDANKKQLKEGTDYRIVPDPTSPVGGTYMNVIAQGIGNYTGEVKIWYRDVDPSKDIAKMKNTKLTAMQYAAGGATVDKQSIENLFEGNLISGKDYVAAGYINNIKPGTAKLVVKGIGEYGGVKLISFKVKGKKGVIKGAYIDGVWK